MNSSTIAGLLFTLFLIVGFASSDFAEDRKECSDMLVGLSPCLTFVSGSDSESVPSPTCCAALIKLDYNRIIRCLCIAVKDRNEPQLGIKINATLALSLPSLCNVPSNATVCLALLHLAPGSPDAQVFEQFNSSLASSNRSVVPADNTRSSSSSTTATVKGRWVGKVSPSPWLVISILLAAWAVY